MINQKLLQRDYEYEGIFTELDEQKLLVDKLGSEKESIATKNVDLERKLEELQQEIDHLKLNEHTPLC